ncbi:MAG: 1-(5-phosphoribosyl)-5-[(5-phosphoribosylamino)methylideneamino] imidazole-4-carboxamide isomerase [Actinomycetota bacterium]|nr:1-(5-phosphoribosyl)-5-[(5-phosphoribosylamino)methylideneamino] imidazole-4-carboxamide isomerase [Actinomycetota bacterium]
MDLFPAVDVIGGTAVRLVQGDFGRRSEYGDPVALARRYVEAGAPWVHVVDLDAARTGHGANRAVVAELVEAVAPVPVQVGGGVRRTEDAEELLGCGAARVVLGTAAVKRPAWAAELALRFPHRIAIGVDHRGGKVSVAGWEETGSDTVAELLDRFAAVPLAAFVVTAIERDGMLGGPDTDGLRGALAGTGHPVVASGGVASADDLRALAALDVGGRRLAGAVVGRALVDGVLGIEEALAACVPSV